MMRHLLTVAILTLPVLSACGEKEEKPFFQVQGQAKIEKRAELFRVGVEINERGKDRMQSLEAAANKVDEVRSELARLQGLEKLTITTSDAETKAVRPRGCDPDQSYRENYPENCDPVDFISSIVMVIEGYPAEAAGSAVSLLTELGVEQADLQGFDVEDRVAAAMEARRQALQDATETARALAEQAGAIVGTPIEILYGESRYREPMRAAPRDQETIVVSAARRSAVALSLAPDQVEFEAQVTVKFALEKPSAGAGAEN